jgi:hypothetical protein
MPYSTMEMAITGCGAIEAAPQPRPPDGPPPSSAGGIQPEVWAGRPARLSRMDRLCALSLCAVDAALRDAHIDPLADAWPAERCAVSLGTAFGCHATNEDYYRGLIAEAGLASPRLFAYTLPSSPVGEISIHYRVLGPATTLATGLTAGVEVLLDAARHLETKRADRVLAVAADVATPLLQRLTGRAQLLDAAAAVILEPATAAAGPRAPRLIGGSSTFSAGDRPTAVREAIARTLHSTGRLAREVGAILLPDEDVAAAREIGVTSEVRPFAPAALGAAPLLALIGALRVKDDTGLLLVASGDPAGRGAAALVRV